MKWIFVIVTVVALIYLFAGSKAAQQMAIAPAGGKTIDGQGKDVLMNTTAQAGNTVNGFTPPVMAISPSNPQMTLLVVAPSPVIETGQRPSESKLKYV